MKQKRHKPEEIIRLLRECDGSGLSQESFARQKQISVATLQLLLRLSFFKPGFLEAEEPG